MIELENNYCIFSLSLTVAPEALSAPAAAAPERAVRDVVSAVDGRLALVARLGATVVDALVAVDGLVARRRDKSIIYSKEKYWSLLVARVCDVGRSFTTVVLLVVADARDDAAADDVTFDGPPVAPVEAVFAGGFVDCWGGLALVLVVETAGTVDDEELPSGAVESIVVCWVDGDVESEAFGTVEGRVDFGTGLTVDRDEAVAVVVVAVGAGFGFAVAVVIVEDFAGTSR